MPPFEPLRVRGGGGHRLRRALWRQRHALAVGLALTAAALAATGLAGGGAGGDTAHGTEAGGTAGVGPERARRPVPLVSAPVRIADAGTVRLLRPGDRVDVIAAEGSGAGARVLVKGARVADVPEALTESPAEDGALIVLSVPRGTAAALAGAGISASLAVTLC